MSDNLYIPLFRQSHEEKPFDYFLQFGNDLQNFNNEYKDITVVLGETETHLEKSFTRLANSMLKCIDIVITQQKADRDRLNSPDFSNTTSKNDDKLQSTDFLDMLSKKLNDCLTKTKLEVVEFISESLDAKYTLDRRLISNIKERFDLEVNTSKEAVELHIKRYDIASRNRQSESERIIQVSLITAHEIKMKKLLHDMKVLEDLKRRYEMSLDLKTKECMNLEILLKQKEDELKHKKGKFKRSGKTILKKHHSASSSTHDANGNVLLPPASTNNSSIASSHTTLQHSESEKEFIDMDNIDHLDNNDNDNIIMKVLSNPNDNDNDLVFPIQAIDPLNQSPHSINDNDSKDKDSKTLPIGSEISSTGAITVAYCTLCDAYKSKISELSQTLADAISELENCKIMSSIGNTNTSNNAQINTGNNICELCKSTITNKPTVTVSPRTEAGAEIERARAAPMLSASRDDISQHISQSDIHSYSYYPTTAVVNVSINKRDDANKLSSRDKDVLLLPALPSSLAMNNDFKTIPSSPHINDILEVHDNPHHGATSSPLPSLSSLSLNLPNDNVDANANGNDISNKHHVSQVIASNNITTEHSPLINSSESTAKSTDNAAMVDNNIYKNTTQSQSQQAALTSSTTTSAINEYMTSLKPSLASIDDPLLTEAEELMRSSYIITGNYMHPYLENMYKILLKINETKNELQSKVFSLDYHNAKLSSRLRLDEDAREKKESLHLLQMQERGILLRMLSEEVLNLRQRNECLIEEKNKLKIKSNSAWSSPPSTRQVNNNISSDVKKKEMFLPNVRFDDDFGREKETAGPVNFKSWNRDEQLGSSSHSHSLNELLLLPDIKGREVGAGWRPSTSASSGGNAALMRQSLGSPAAEDIGWRRHVGALVLNSFDSLGNPFPQTFPELENKDIARDLELKSIRQQILKLLAETSSKERKKNNEAPALMAVKKAMDKKLATRIALKPV